MVKFFALGQSVTRFSVTGLIYSLNLRELKMTRSILLAALLALALVACGKKEEAAPAPAAEAPMAAPAPAPAAAPDAAAPAAAPDAAAPAAPAAPAEEKK
jgi:hypothetical protein